jgi:hypothetical protein
MSQAVALWLALVFPSLFVVQKYFGWAATLGYAVVAATAVALRRRLPVPRSHRAVRLSAAATLVLVAAVFVAVYPSVNVLTPGRGSDDDDTYNIGARALVAGRSPYDEVTYLGNALHPLPGSFLLAIPFEWFGTSAWQNVFWLTLFFVVVKTELGSERETLRLAWLVLALSPTVMHQVVTGTAHGANTIYVLLGLWWLIRTRLRTMAAVAWGVTLASRANFLFLLPLAFGWVCAREGWREALRTTGLTSLTVAAITIPFYLHDPARFGPLEGANRLLRFDTLVPFAGEIIAVLMAGVAVMLARRSMNEPTLFASCAIVQALPVVLGTLLGSVQRGHADLAYAAYGTFAAWFVIMAVALGDER